MKCPTRILPTLLCALSSVFAFGQTTEFAPRQVLVKFKGSASVAASSALVANRALKANNLSVISQLQVNVIQIPQGMSVMDAVAYYKRLSTVEYAEPNYAKKAYYVPNDPMWNQQYGQKLVKCPEAWNLTKGKTTVTVAIIDSGIDLNHEDLKNKLVPGYDFSDDDPDPTAAGDHGVHVAGISAADTDNSKGVAGTGFNVKIMPLKIFPNSFAATSAKAIMFAADKGAKVINMSYGSYAESATERNAVNYAWNKGVVLLAASGNDGITNKSYPAAFTNVIAVGATNAQDIRDDYSNYGPDWVDVGAPGTGIMSTVTGGYALNTGTSMASPMAAGVVALMWSFAAPGTTNAQIRAVLESTTDPISNGGFKNGRVNAFKACSALDPGTAITSNPTGVSLWSGAGFSGTTADLLASDGASVSATSASSSVGQLAAITVDIAFNGPATNLREATALVESNALSGTSGQLYLWDYPSNKYVLIQAFKTLPTGVTREKIKLPLNLSRYVSGGSMKMGLRAIGPNRSPKSWGGGVFNFTVGFVQVSTREVFNP